MKYIQNPDVLNKDYVLVYIRNDSVELNDVYSVTLYFKTYYTL